LQKNDHNKKTTPYFDGKWTKLVEDRNRTTLAPRKRLGKNIEKKKADTQMVLTMARLEVTPVGPRTASSSSFFLPPMLPSLADSPPSKS
jgi:hypothetical protein